MFRSLLMLATSALFASGAAWSADVACFSGPIAVQIDQDFEKRESYTAGGREYAPFARQFGGVRSIRVSRRTHGQTRLIVPMTQESRLVRGAGVMTMEADDHIRARTQSCSHKRTFVVNWSLQGTVSDACTIDFTVVREWTEQGTRRPCSADFFGTFAGVYPPIVETWQISVKAELGATAKREVGNFSAKDASTVTIVPAAP